MGSGAGRGICKEGREDSQLGVEWCRCCPITVLRKRTQKMTRYFYMVPFDAVTIVPCLFSPRISLDFKL